MIPLALITGFLGSGKTTLLKQLARRERGHKIVWLVNEFSAHDVDATVLEGETSDVVSIAGGSIFCRCLVTEFIASLRDLPARFDTPEAPVTGVVVEASGMANPAVAATLLREAQLDTLYRLANVIAIADPGTFLKLLHTLPNIRAQIEAAQQILLNKTDLHPPAQIKTTEAALREINPTAPITRTSYCAAEIDLFSSAAAPDIHGELAPCRDPDFESFTWTPPPTLDLAQLRATLATVADDLFRIKGFVHCAGRSLHVDYSSSGWQQEPAPASATIELVFIVRRGCTAIIQRMLAGK